MTEAADQLQWRSAAPADADALADLWARGGVGSGQAIDRAEILLRLEQPDELFVIGELVGERSGEIGASAMVCWDGHRAHVKRVVVDPGLHGQGLGQQLMAEVERRLCEAGISELRLAVWDENERGGRFWEAQGWVELPTIRYFTKSIGEQS